MASRIARPAQDEPQAVRLEQARRSITGRTPLLLLRPRAVGRLADRARGPAREQGRIRQGRRLRHWSRSRSEGWIRPAPTPAPVLPFQVRGAVPAADPT